MGKKGVPDWLNSSLWYSSPSFDDRITRYATKSSPEPTPRPPPIREPSPPPPAAPVRDDPTSDAGSCYPKSLSPEEASRQALLVAEVSKKVINIGELQRLVCQGIPDGAEIRATVWKAHAEADTFFCFVELLSGFRDNFCKQLDNSVVGIRSTITRLSQLLKKHDEELWRHLEITTKVNPQFYAFRWITLLLTQEFDFTECLHIWDTLLSDPEGPQETLLRICCAMLILVRRRLLAGDFTSNLKLLQHYPNTNIGHLLHVANKLRGALTG